MSSRTGLRRDLGLLLLLVVTGLAPAQEWTRFRGPNGSGVSETKGIPSLWTSNDFRWKTPMPAPGHGSPVIWANRVFVNAGDDKQARVSAVAVDAKTGAVNWEKHFPFKPFAKHNYNSFASGSPAVDAGRVYYCFALPERFLVIALTHAGDPVWQREFGRFASQHGGGHSPILYDGKLVVGNEQDGESFLLCLRGDTGETVWKTPRKTAETAYSTPCVFQPPGGKAQLIFNSEAHGISGIDPESGSVLWELPKVFDKRVVSSPIVAGELVLGACGSGGGGNYVVAVRPGDASTSPERVYTIRKSAPYVPTSIYHDGLLFLWSDGGIVSCADALTGEVLWQERVGGNYFGSPVLVGGRLFGISSRGEVVVVEAGKIFKVLARNPLGELTHSSPAVAAGRFYVRTAQHLFCIGEEAP